MKNKSVKEVVLSGLFIAIGLILPMIFHAFGVGSTFLPMHIPIFLAGFIIRIPFAIAVGILTPILSSILTGMPPVFPVLPYMVFELATYGAVSSLFYRKLKLNIYFSLIASMIIGRIVSAIVVCMLATFFSANLPGPFVFIAGGIVSGIPGIIIQIVFIPTIALVLNKNTITKREAL